MNSKLFNYEVNAGDAIFMNADIYLRTLFVERSNSSRKLNDYICSLSFNFCIEACGVLIKNTSSK